VTSSSSCHSVPVSFLFFVECFSSLSIDPPCGTSLSDVLSLFLISEKISAAGRLLALLHSEGNLDVTSSGSSVTHTFLKYLTSLFSSWLEVSRCEVDEIIQKEHQNCGKTKKKIRKEMNIVEREPNIRLMCFLGICASATHCLTSLIQVTILSYFKNIFCFSLHFSHSDSLSSPLR
jgi:hypothetical protein